VNSAIILEQSADMFGCYEASQFLGTPAKLEALRHPVEKSTRPTSKSRRPSIYHSATNPSACSPMPPSIWIVEQKSVGRRRTDCALYARDQRNENETAQARREEWRP
jgi:hypothetical protein